MPTYHNPIAAAALRVDALVGAQKAALETTYTTRPLTDANFQSAIFPFSDFLAACGWAEQQIAGAIADTGNSPYQAYIRSNTATIINGGPLPAVDKSGVPIIGIWGAVKDGTSGNVCFKKDLSEIQRRVTNANNFWVVPVYYYRMEGLSIYHTRTNVKIDCCVYDADAQAALIAADGDLLFPTLENLYVWGMLGKMIRDDEFTGQGSIFQGYFDDGLMALRRGLQSVSGSSAQSPVAA